MIELKIEPTVAGLLETLHKKGFEAYVVGGCVRDQLLGKVPQDWDITTNATPEEVINCFSDYSVIPTGIKHGTVSVIVEHVLYEITTYRVDGEYEDHRRPNQVSFTKSLEEDLARRDFTINALAYNHVEGLQDFFGGLKDIEDEIIRCVGEPHQRLHEDPLRIMRCVRFACDLGFTIEVDTRQALFDEKEKLNYIAKERIQVELNKSLLGDYFKAVFAEHQEIFFQILPELKPLLDFKQDSKYHQWDVLEHTLATVDVAPKEIWLKLIMLLHDAGKPDTFTRDKKGFGHFPNHAKISSELARNVMNRLKYSNEIKSKVIRLIELHDLDVPPRKNVLKRRLQQLGEETLRQLLVVQWCDAMGKADEYKELRIAEIIKCQQLIDEIIAENSCFSIRQLEVTGKDLIELGVPENKQIGETLSHLLDLVVGDRLENSREHLLEEARRWNNLQ